MAMEPRGWQQVPLEIEHPSHPPSLRRLIPRSESACPTASAGLSKECETIFLRRRGHGIARLSGLPAPG
jgi:hypothetical protein